MATGKKAVGKAIDYFGGLDAIGKALEVEASTPYAPLSDFMPDPEQPRKNFDEVELRRLGKGMSSDGILQALLVRDNTTGEGPRFIIIDGERRWRAADFEGIEQLPYMVRNDIDVKRLRFAQAMANANRKDLTDFELAVVVKEMLDGDQALRKADIAEQLGKDPAVISRLLNLLDPEYVELAKSGLIESASTLSHFRRLDEGKRAEMLSAAREQGKAITRDAVEEARKAIQAPVIQQPAANDTPTATPSVEAEKNEVLDAVSSSDAVESGIPGEESGAINESSDLASMLSGDGSNDAADLSAGGLLEPENNLPESGYGSESDENTGTVATPRPKAGDSGSKAAASSVKLTLNIEMLERLIPFFVDKENTKIEIRISQDEATGLIENLGKPVPDNLNEFAGVIKAAMD